MSPIRLAVLLSGGGTTLQNFIDRIADRLLDARIVQVISSRADVFGVERARRAGAPVSVIKPKESASPEEFGNRALLRLDHADRSPSPSRTLNPKHIGATGDHLHDPRIEQSIRDAIDEILQ